MGIKKNLAVCVVALGITFLAGIYLNTSSATIMTTVQSKKFTPDFIMSQVTIIGGDTFIIPVHCPETYEINFVVNGRAMKLAVGKDFYKTIKEGDKIEVRYATLTPLDLIEPLCAKKIDDPRTSAP